MLKHINRFIFYFFVILIGYVSLIGHVSESLLLKNAGLNSASSPLPATFSKFSQLNSFKKNIQIVFFDENNKLETLDITNEIFKNISGPFIRKKYYESLFHFSSDPIQSQFKALKMLGLKRSLCGETYLQFTLGLPKNMKLFKVKALRKNMGQNTRQNTEQSAEQDEYLIRCIE